MLDAALLACWLSLVGLVAGCGTTRGSDGDGDGDSDADTDADGPPGDLCNDPVTLELAQDRTSVEGTTRGASDDTNANDCGDGTHEPDVVYSFRPAEAGRFWAGVSTAAHGGWHPVAYLRPACQAGVENECSDSCGNDQSTCFSACVVPGAEYFLIVDGYGGVDGDSGDFTLEHEFTPCQCDNGECP